MAKKKGVASSDSYLSRAASANANMSAATKKQRARDFASGVAEITGVRVGRKGIKNVDPVTAGLNAMSLVPGLGEVALGAKAARGAAAMGKAERAIALAGKAGKELSAARKVAASVNKAAKVAKRGPKVDELRRLWSSSDALRKMDVTGKGIGTAMSESVAARSAAKQVGRTAGKKAGIYASRGAKQKMNISQMIETGQGFREKSRLLFPKGNAGAFKGRTLSEGMVAKGKKMGSNITDLKATIRGTGSASPVRRGLERVSNAAKAAKNTAANAGTKGVVKSASDIAKVRKSVARVRKSPSRPVELDRLIGELFK